MKYGPFFFFFPKMYCKKIVFIYRLALREKLAVLNQKIFPFIYKQLNNSASIISQKLNKNMATLMSTLVHCIQNYVP